MNPGIRPPLVTLGPGCEILLAYSPHLVSFYRREEGKRNSTHQYKNILGPFTGNISTFSPLLPTTNQHSLHVIWKHVEKIEIKVS